jgi:hypothetical protein
MKSPMDLAFRTVLMLALTALGCVPMIRVEPQPVTFGEAFYVKDPAVVPQLSDEWDCILVPLELGIVVPEVAPKEEPAAGLPVPALPEPASKAQSAPEPPVLQPPAEVVVKATLLQGAFPRERAARLTTASDLTQACERLSPNAGPTSSATIKVENVQDGLLTATLYLVAKPGRPLEAGDLLELELKLVGYNGVTHTGLRLENGAHSLVGLLTGVGLIVAFTVVTAAAF